MLECRTAEDVREANRRRLEWREKMFPKLRPAPQPSEESIAKSVIKDEIPPGYIAPKDAAEQLGIHHAYVLYWCRRTAFAIKRNGRWLIDVAALEKLRDSAGPPKTNTDGMWDCVRVASACKRLSPSGNMASQIIDDLRWLFGQQTRSAFMADRREPHRVLARWCAFHLMEQKTAWSIKGISRYWQRDHTTVLHGINELRKLRGSDHTIDFLLTWLEAQYDAVG